MNDLLSKYPNVDTLATSTNFTTYKPLLKWLKEISDFAEVNDRKLRAEIQISIDGDEETTNRNRGNNVFAKIEENLGRLMEDSHKLSKKMELHIHTKSTNDANDFKRWLDDENELLKYLHTFERLENKFDNWPSNVRIRLVSLPTLALPGNYTKEDGIAFYRLHRKLQTMERDENIKYSNLDQYYVRVRELFSTISKLENISQRYNAFNCSAGLHQFCMDPDMTKHGCHGSFWYNYDDYLESTETNPEWKEGKRVLSFDKETFKSAADVMTADARDMLNSSRLNYILYSFANGIEHRLNVCYGTIKALALAGQISNAYKDENMVNLFALFMTLAGPCWLNNYFTTSTLYAPPTSVYKIYGNGLFELMLDTYIKEMRLNTKSKKDLSC
jgi:hypothetical protein